MKYLKQHLLSISIIFILFLFLTPFLRKVEAVYFADDTVYVFHKGIKITNNSVMWKNADGSFYFPEAVCLNGKCKVGQQFEPSYIIKSSSEIFTQDEWEDHYHLNTLGCEGYVSEKKEIEERWFQCADSKFLDQQKEDLENELYEQGLSRSEVKEQSIKLFYDCVREGGFPYFGDEECEVDHNDYIAYLNEVEEEAEYIHLFDPGVSEGGAGCGSEFCIGGRSGDFRTYLYDVSNGFFFGMETSWLIVSFIAGTTLMIFIIVYVIRKRRKI